jgi:hypothetical protein
VELLNLTASGRLAFRLPRPALRFDTYFGRKRIEHHSQLHSVIIEPDEMRVQMVWHTSLQCHYTLYQLERTVVGLKRRIPSVGGRALKGIA